jgi:hypothetical protein
VGLLSTSPATVLDPPSLPLAPAGYHALSHVYEVLINSMHFPKSQIRAMQSQKTNSSQVEWLMPIILAP